MKTHLKKLAITLTAFLSVASFPISALPGDSELKVGAAVWNLFDSADRHALHTAYIHAPLQNYYNIRPTVLLITADEGQHYFAVGAAKDVYTHGDLSVRVAFHAGIVDESEDLGDSIEFYSSVSAMYRLNQRLSLEAEVGHISNGGLGDTNPGSESFVTSLHYHF